LNRASAIALLVLAALALAACQSTPPPAADEKAVTIGDWTVRTGGYVRAEGGIVK
jgi:hypothetical protein